MVTNEESALLNVTARERPDGPARGRRASAVAHPALLARTTQHAALARLPLRCVSS